MTHPERGGGHMALSRGEHSHVIDKSYGLSQRLEVEAGDSAMFTLVFVFVALLCFSVSYQQAEFQVCHLCADNLQNGTAVGNFCTSLPGEVEGRCCWRKEADRATIVGLDLSNCSLRHIEDLQEASTAIMIDLSANPVTNISDSVFQGFIELHYLILPLTLQCPGGNASWEKVVSNGSVCLCEGQKNACYQAGNMSWNCPENSLCAPDGPGSFQCSCVGEFHGYKCLREGWFPTFPVFSILGVSTFLMSVLLWYTQRRKAKSI
ncbi:all-trans retinoic acid-induced differentiation factor isoform X1 [Arapaima gigas]